jgi:hypothetical protein
MKKMFLVHTHHPSCMTLARVGAAGLLWPMYVTVPTYLRRHVHLALLCVTPTDNVVLRATIMMLHEICTHFSEMYTLNI